MVSPWIQAGARAAIRRRRHRSRATQHLVDLAGVQFFDVDHLARVFFQRNGTTFRQRQKVPVQIEGDVLCFERFAQNRSDVEDVRIEKRTDRQGRVRAESGDPFAGLLSVQQRFVGLLPQPRHNGNAAKSKHQE